MSVASGAAIKRRMPCAYLFNANAAAGNRQTKPPVTALGTGFLQQGRESIADIGQFYEYHGNQSTMQVSLGSRKVHDADVVPRGFLRAEPSFFSLVATTTLVL